MSKRREEIPYPGLRPFTADEKDIFFGRDDHIKQIAEKLFFSQFVAVVGPSGCGKSSLLQAGLIPRLHDFFEEEWRIVQMRPGDNPIYNLAKALLDKNALGPERMKNEINDLWEDEVFDEEQLFWEELGFINAKLNRGSLELLKLIESTPLPEKTNILIFVDQFEELFRYRTEENFDTYEYFVALLIETIQQQTFEQIYLMIGIRSDFIGDCAIYSSLPEIINESQFLVPRLTRDQCREAIVGPANIHHKEFESELVNALLNDMSTEPDSLPLLQHIIVLMWSSKKTNKNEKYFLTLSDYEELKGIQNALTDHADKVFEDLQEKDKKITSIMFKQLTQKTASNQNIRRPISLSVICDIANVKDTDEINSIIDHFEKENCYFFSRSHAESPEDTILDLSHESLIRKWEKLNNWIEEESRDGQVYSYVLKTAKLNRDGEFNNFTIPYLGHALKWQKEFQPNKAWADRYGGEYDLCDNFLKKSKFKRNIEKIILFTFMFSIICLTVVSVVEWNKANTLSTERTNLLFESKIRQTSMLAEQNELLNAKELISGTTELENDVPQYKKHARNLLQWYVNYKGSYSYSELFTSERQVDKVVTSKDDTWVAALSNNRIYLYNQEKKKITTMLDSKDAFVDILFLHSKNQLIAATETGIIKRYSIPKFHELPQWTVETNINTISLSPDSKYLAVGFTDGIYLMNINDQSTKLLNINEETIKALQFSPDGKYIASTSNLWDLNTKKIISKIPRSSICGIQYSPDARLMALWDSKTTIHLLTTSSWSKHIDTLDGHKGRVNDVEFLSNGNYLYHILSASADGTIRMWDSEEGSLNGIFEGFHVQVSDIHLSNGHLYAVGDKYKVICLKHFDKQINNKHRIYDLPQKPVHCSFSSNGSKIIVGFDNGHISVHHTTGLQVIWEKTLHDSQISGIDCHNNYFASISMYKLLLNDINTGKELLSITDYINGYCALKFSSDGKYLIVGNDSGEISIFSTATMKIQIKKKIHDNEINSIIVDQHHNIFSSTNEGKIRVWNFLDPSPKITNFTELTTSNMMGAAFSAHNQSFAAIGQNNYMQNVIRLYQNKKSTEIITEGGTIYRVIFSPDGMQLLTLSQDSTIRFWDLSTDQELFALKLPVKPHKIFNFDYQCSETGDCWIGVPLLNKQLMIFHQKDIFEKVLQ